MEVASYFWGSRGRRERVVHCRDCGRDGWNLLSPRFLHRSSGWWIGLLFLVDIVLPSRQYPTSCVLFMSFSGPSVGASKTSNQDTPGIQPHREVAQVRWVALLIRCTERQWLRTQQTLHPFSKYLSNLCFWSLIVANKPPESLVV